MLGHEQWDQIWGNFAPVVIFLDSLAIFREMFSIWQNMNILWSVIYAIGQTFIVVNGQILSK